ncbi:MAG: hypothetical protein ACREQI_11625 [Candidatus Binataceae bacterium]
MASEVTDRSAIESESGPGEANNLGVFAYLAILIAAQVAVYFAGFPASVRAGLLIALGAANAVLSAIYFMGLAFERKTLWAIAAVPAILAILCYFAMLPDLSHRTWAHTPEHRTAAPAMPPAGTAPAASLRRRRRLS